MVLEGHNRWVACERLGVSPKTEDFNGGNPWNYVWSLNGQRRDLVEEQRYLIWKHCEQNGADFQAQLQNIEEEANRKRSEAAKEQPRTEGGRRLSCGPGADLADLREGPEAVLSGECSRLRCARASELGDATSRPRPRRPVSSICPRNGTLPRCFGRTCKTPGGAWLAMAGVHPKVVQTVLRHSAITLTMDTYGHLFPGQDAAAVAALPSMMNGPRDETEALAATGTDDAAARHGSRYGSSGDAKPFTETAGTCESDQDAQNATDDPNVLTINGLRGEKRDVAKVRLLGLEPRTYGLKVRCSTD